MFSGAAQILATQLVAAGAPVAVTILTCFVVGLRFLMYSAAMAPHLKDLPPHWRNVLAFLLTDQAFAAGIRRFRETGDLRNGASYFLGSVGVHVVDREHWLARHRDELPSDVGIRFTKPCSGCALADAVLADEQQF